MWSLEPYFIRHSHNFTKQFNLLYMYTYMRLLQDIEDDLGKPQKKKFLH